MRMGLMEKRRSWIARPVSALAIAAMLIGTPGLAQQAPKAPKSTPTPQSTPTPEATPNPQATPPAAPLPPPVPVVLPTLSPAQAAQLATLLTPAYLAQGLRYSNEGKAALPTDNDGLVRAALDYAHAVHGGRLDAEDFQNNWGMRPAAYDPLPAFADAVKRDRLASWMTSLAPAYAGYDGLRKGLIAYRAIDAAGGWPKLAAGPDLGAGASGPRVLALRKRLAIEDNQVAATGDSFDAELTEAVKRAQRRYGLNPSGLVSTQTLAALNVPASDRVRQIMANMERWRWLPQDLLKRRIQVNIAAAILTLYDNDQPIASMKAVTGRPGDETPMLQSAIHSIVLNPPWNVPAGIAAKELFPKGPAYLRAHGFKVIGEGANRRLQQQAGTQSALGRYKFDFDNPYAVYLHDTPSQATFSSFSRLASHGCVRLEKPAELAQFLLQTDPVWGQPGAIDAAIDKGDTLRVKLSEPVAVYLFYWTSYASANGVMNFRGDPYGWDKVLAEKIEARAAARAAVPTVTTASR